MCFFNDFTFKNTTNIILTISDMTREQMPIWHRERILRTINFKITPQRDIFIVVLAYPKAWSEEVRTPSKQNKTNTGASTLMYLLPIVVL